jgi:hypothetical protein
LHDIYTQVRFRMDAEATHPRDDWGAADGKKGYENDTRLPFDTRAEYSGEYMQASSTGRRALGQVRFLGLCVPLLSAAVLHHSAFARILLPWCCVPLTVVETSKLV